MTQEFELLCERVASHFSDEVPGKIGVAVSGGSDSLALLILLADWSSQGGPAVFAATVDHGLRAESTDEAAYVSKICAGLGVPHATLNWHKKEINGNLQDSARRARYDLLAKWARDKQLETVAIAHTLDDVAETFVMRLARDAGIDGLAAMKESWRHGSVRFVRPALALSRSDLQRELRSRQITWIDDPSNEDDRHERARIRKALSKLDDLGICSHTLARTAHRMAEVRRTLYHYVCLAAKDIATFHQGDAFLDAEGFHALAPDIARRLLQEILLWISGASYPPRGHALNLLLNAIRGGTGMTLHGCIITNDGDRLHVTREASAVADEICFRNELWDGRWRIDGPGPDRAEIRYLGNEGLALCPDWRESGMSLHSLKASPAVWIGEQLIAAPLAGLGKGWTAELLRDEDHFFAHVLTH